MLSRLNSSHFLLQCIRLACLGVEVKPTHQLTNTTDTTDTTNTNPNTGSETLTAMAEWLRNLFSTPSKRSLLKWPLSALYRLVLCVSCMKASCHFLAHLISWSPRLLLPCNVQYVFCYRSPPWAVTVLLLLVNA